MFTPTGNGVLYYHDITTATSAITAPSIPWHRYPVSASQWTNAAVAMPRPRPALARPAVLRGRRALRRSVDLFRMLRSEAEVKTFISGKPLLIHGHRFDYRVQRRESLLHHTMNPHSAHIPYDLHLIEKDSGQQLARGCVIIPGTPVIDQLLALILHVQDADEEPVVLRSTNWTPPLPQRFRQTMPLAA